MSVNALCYAERMLDRALLGYVLCGVGGNKVMLKSACSSHAVCVSKKVCVCLSVVCPSLIGPLMLQPTPRPEIPHISGEDLAAKLHKVCNVPINVCFEL